MSPPAYRPLGGLRLLLAVAVVAGHAAWIVSGTPVAQAFETWKPGAVAVFAFFLMSGFILSEGVASFYAGRPRAFLANRCLKILPMFAGALALSVLVHAAAAIAGRLPAGLAFEGYDEMPDAMFGVANILLNVLSFMPSLVTDPLRSALDADPYLFVRYVWAVKVEVLFYAVLAIALAFGRMPSASPLAGVWLAVALVAVNAAIGVSQELRYAPYFIVGVCLFLVTRDRRAVWPGLAGAVLAVHHAAGFFDGSLPPILLLVACAILCAASCLASLSGPLAEIDRNLGNLSYALYLTHYPVLVGLSSFADPAGPVWFLATIALCVLVAHLSSGLVERPLRPLRERLRAAGRAREAKGTGPHGGLAFDTSTR